MNRHKQLHISQVIEYKIRCFVYFEAELHGNIPGNCLTNMKRTFHLLYKLAFFEIQVKNGKPIRMLS